jgi:hypothetical protein
LFYINSRKTSKRNVDQRRVSAEQQIITNNYHNILQLDQFLINTSSIYLKKITEFVFENQYLKGNFMEIIGNIFRNLSNSFISAFLNVIGHMNKMLDSTRDLVLNYELYNMNSMINRNTLQPYHLMKRTVDYVKISLCQLKSISGKISMIVASNLIRS